MKKTIIFALSALLVGACAKEDPEEPVLPEIPPRGFSLDNAPFYLASTTYDAGAFSRSDLQLYLTSKEGKEELYIQMDMAHLGKKIDLSQPEKGIVPPGQPWEFRAPSWRIYGEEGHTAESGSYLQIKEGGAVSPGKRFVIAYHITYKGHTAQGNETLTFVERIPAGLYYKGAKIEPRVGYTLANQRLVISLSDPNNMDNAFTFELSEEHLGKLLPLDKVDSNENYWSIQLPSGSRYEGKAGGHLAPSGSWIRVTPIGNHYKLQFFISNDFKANL